MPLLDDIFAAFQGGGQAPPVGTAPVMPVQRSAPMPMAPLPPPETELTAPKKRVPRPDFNDGYSEAGTILHGLFGNGVIGGLGQAMSANASHGAQVEARNQTYDWLTSKKNIDPETAKLIVTNPDVAKQMLPKLLGIRGDKREWKQIGEDQYGKKSMGWVNPSTGEVTPVEIAGAQGGANAADPSENAYLGGEDFLKTLDPARAARLRAIAEGRQRFPVGRAATTPDGLRLIDELNQFSPELDATNYRARERTNADFSSGPESRNTSSLNTVIGHIDELNSTVDSLNNFNTWGFTALNAPVNWAADKLSPDFQGREGEFTLAKQAVATEMMKAFRGGVGVGSMQEIEDWKEELDSAKSPDALHKIIRMGVRLLRSRLEALANQYNRGMSTENRPLPLLSPGTVDAFNRLEGLPSDGGDASAPASTSDVSAAGAGNPAQIQDGQTAINRTTGQRIIFRGGKWQSQ